MGGRGGSSKLNVSGNVTESTLSELKNKMAVLARYTLPGLNYDAKKAKQYYKVQRQFNDARNKYNEQLDKKVRMERSKSEQSGTKSTFVNSFGEATQREITSLAYKRQQRRLGKEILNRLR